MLLWALNPENPYGYYVLLRWICCGIFAYLAFKGFEQGHQGWVLVLGITAAVYNPIFRVHLTREIWSVVNVAAIGTAVASTFALRFQGAGAAGAGGGHCGAGADRGRGVDDR
jgi:hypothetical protein